MLLLFSAPGRAQQPAKQSPKPVATTNRPIHPTRDPQALSVLNQALSVAGGLEAIKAVKDYTASGTMPFGTTDQSSQVNLTIMEHRPFQFRMDANAPSGVTSLSIDHGKAKTMVADGGIFDSSTIPELSPDTLVFPHLLLAGAVVSPFFTVLYKGVVEVGGHSAHDIRIQITLPDGIDPKGVIPELTATDVFVDSSTFQLLASRDTIHPIKNNQIGYPHEIQYSDYRSVNGVLIPFSITELFNSQQSRALHLNSMNFNSGLTDSQFELKQNAR